MILPLKSYQLLTVLSLFRCIVLRLYTVSLTCCHIWFSFQPSEPSLQLLSVQRTLSRYLWRAIKNLSQYPGNPQFNLYHAILRYFYLQRKFTFNCEVKEIEWLFRHGYHTKGPHSKTCLFKEGINGGEGWYWQHNVMTVTILCSVSPACRDWLRLSSRALPGDGAAVAVTTPATQLANTLPPCQPRHYIIYWNVIAELLGNVINISKY